MLVDREDSLRPLLDAAVQSKNANIATLRSLVMKILSHPEVFCGYSDFKEILLSSLQSAQEGETLMATLDLFAYGNFADYARETEKYLTLTESQIFKLRQLTTLSVVENACENRHRSVPYSAFVAPLQLQDSAEVESFITSCIYGGAISGQLCQATSSLLLAQEGAVLCPRDVSPSRVPVMITSVQQLQQRIEQSISGLAQQQLAIDTQLENHKAWLKETEENIKKASHDSQKGQSRAWGGRPATAGAEPMDVSWPTGPSPRRQKRGRGNVTEKVLFQD